jgi:hypothetical protein
MQVPGNLTEGERNAPTQEAAIVERHVSRLAPSYAATFSEADIAHHAGMAMMLSEDNPVEVEAVRGPARGCGG